MSKDGTKGAQEPPQNPIQKPGTGKGTSKPPKIN